MANKKITDLTELTAAASDDYLEIVDTSANASKKISRENLIAGHDHDTAYLGISAKAADSDKLDGLDSTDFVDKTTAQTIAGIKTFSSIPVLPASNPTTANQAVRKGFADATYLGISAKASDSDKLDNIDSTGFVQTSGNQTVAGVKTFSSIPVLPSTDPTTANQAVRKGFADATYGRPVFLTTPKTSTSWDGDNKGTGDRATVDLSEVFGVPAGVKAVLMSVQTQAAAANNYIRFGPSSTYSHALTCRTAVGGQIAHAFGIVPCDSDGDIYCHPSGTVEGVYVWIWGYWL